MKYLGIFPKIRGGGNSARVWVKTATLAAAIVLLVYSVMWCGLLWNVMVCSVIWHVVWWFCGGAINYFSFVKWLFSTPPGKPTVLLNNRL